MKTIPNQWLLYIVVIVGETSIGMAAWPRLPTDSEIARAVDDFVENNTMEGERIDCSTIEDPGERAR